MSEHAQVNHSMTIRRMDLTGADRKAVDRLAERDTHDRIEGPVLGAEVEGRLLAAVSLSSGEAIADPFTRSDDVLALLRLRARQLKRRKGAGVRRASRRRRRHPAVGGSAAGSVLTLPRWG